MKGQLKILLAAAVAIAVIFSAAALWAKEAPPTPDKMKKLSFPDFKEFTTENGMEVMVVEHREQPTVTVYFLVKTGGASDPAGKESLAGFTIDQLNKGTATRDALALAEWIESVGGSVGSFSEQEFSVVTVSILSEYLDVAYQYLQDIFLNPTFPDDELELLRTQAKTGLEFELSNPAAMAQRHLRTLVYGDHPYSKQPTVEAVEAITRQDVEGFYKKNFVANNALVGVVGDVKSKDVKKAVEKYFGEWQQGSPDVADYAGAPTASETSIYLYHRPGADQTEIYVGHLAPKAANPDWPAVTVGNRVLGGGADARLFMNLREDKGWTYGAYSSFSREKDLGNFRAWAAVRTEVTDSALVELMGELDRIKTEPVTPEDLKNAKDYLIGNFPIQIETPEQIARQVAQYKLLGLGKDQLETYRDQLAAVTIEDVNRVMGEYLHPQHSYIVLVGDAMVVSESVEKIGSVAMFDIAGEPLSMESMAVTPVQYEYNTAAIGSMKATYGLTYQEMPLGDMNVTVERKADGDSEVVEVSTDMAGMVTMSETMMFRLLDFAPLAYTSKMQMGPNSMGAEYAFTENGVSGTVKSMESPEPKEVAFELVEGTIIDGSLEYAIGCLPLAVDAAYRFPVVETESGTLQNIDVTVLEIVDVETPAGKFSAYKVKIKRVDGEVFFYLDAQSPHVMVKQEVPAQGVNIELKSLEIAKDS